MARMTSEGVLTVSNPRVISKPISEFPLTPEGDAALRAEIARMRGVQDLEASAPRQRRASGGAPRKPKEPTQPAIVTTDDL